MASKKQTGYKTKNVDYGQRLITASEIKNKLFKDPKDIAKSSTMGAGSTKSTLVMDEKKNGKPKEPKWVPINNCADTKEAQKSSQVPLSKKQAKKLDQKATKELRKFQKAFPAFNAAE
ncbi:uncharacterized protein LOC119678617 [Teleopsis dalmanni]|uniref:uncharacterized protein LOC119678617 n=1 Tax=Teleopsis dalmanni TaxID=139649 RepID=UPI0018CD3CD6|nr:uncharacterized protein LOC119678617 [Teleopsis dalmanni]XP_037946482.1 uncharacterized protein LOC119678617 [Teleopsis dalmanni]